MTIVVYNAASVIGQAVSQAFWNEGRTVIGVDVTDALMGTDRANGASNRMHSVTLETPLQSQAQVTDLLDRCMAISGDQSLDALVCVAPPVSQMNVLEVSPEDFRNTVEQELIVPVLLMQEAGRRMVKAGCGRIIVYTSMSAKTGVHPHVSSFAAAKGGLLAYMRVMAAELAKHGVTVNGIALSLFEPQVARLTEERRNQLTQGIPAHRFGKPTEAAAAAVYLASEHAAFITGETLNLSGGRFMD